MPTTPSSEVGVNLLALSGGGFKALAADSGMFAGVIKYFGVDVSGLLHDDLAISANSGSTWFASLLAYSDPFVSSLNDYTRLFSTDVDLDELTVGGADGFLGVMGEAYYKYLFDYLAGDALERLLAGVDSVPQFVSFLTASPGNFARFLAACSLDGAQNLVRVLDQKLTGKLGYETFRGVLTDVASALGSAEILPYVGAITVALMEGVDWNGFMQKVVFAPDQVDRLLQATNFYSGDGRTEALATQSLIYELAISSDEATIAPRSQSTGDGLVKASVTNDEAMYGGLIKNVYNFLPASATSLGNSDQRPAPWLPSIRSGDLSVEYDSPAFFDSKDNTYADLDFQGLSAFLASSISSAAGALGQSVGVINDVDSLLGVFFNALDLLSGSSASTALATFTKGLAPLVQARKRTNGSWTAGDPAYGLNSFSDPVNTLSTADAARQAYLRMADGGYFDNSSVTSGLSYLAANQGSWRANDGIKDFDITLFVFSADAEQISSALVQQGFDQIGNIAERLFTGGNPQQFKLLGADLIDVSHPSSAIFDSTRTSGKSAPIWSYQAPGSAIGVAKGFAIKAYDMDTTTVNHNNMNIAGGYEGSVHLWNIVSPTGAIPLATAGSWGDYEIMYNQIIEGLQVKDGNGIAGAQILASQLKIDGTPTGISISNTVASKGTVAGTVIGWLATADPDAGDSCSYQLVKGKGDDDNAFFAVQADQLIASVGLGFESKTRYQVRLRSTDSHGLWTEQQLIIQQPALQAGPIRGATVLLDERTYHGAVLASNCNLTADPGESVAISDGLGQYGFDPLPDPGTIGNHDDILDWRDGMVVGGVPDSDGRIQLIDSIAGVNLGIPMVGLPGESVSIFTTLKYAALLRWREGMSIAGQPLTPQFITDYFSRIIRDVPSAFKNDAFNPYASLFNEDLVERRRALDSLVFAYSNLTVVKTVIALFEKLKLDYSSPEALAMWGYAPEPLRADRAEIIAFSAYGTAISNRFGSTAPVNPADPFQRSAFAEQFDLADPSHLRVVLKEILAVYPLHEILDEASPDPQVRLALKSERTLEEALIVDRFIEQRFGLLLDKLSQGLERIVAVVDSRLRESAALGEEHVIASISGSKRTMVESLAAELVGLAADPTVDSVAAFEGQFLPLFYRPLSVDATDRTFDYWLSLSAADESQSSEIRLVESVASDPQEIGLLLKLGSLQGLAEAAPDSGLSVHFRVGGSAVEGVDYELGQELEDRTIWIPAGVSEFNWPVRILNPNLAHGGRTLEVQLLSSDSGFGVNLDHSVVHIILPGSPEPLSGLQSSGSANSFLPALLVSQPDQRGVFRAPGREAGNWVLQGQEGVADRFFLTRPKPGAGLPHVNNFDPQDGDTLVIDLSAFPGAKITDFNTYGALVYHVPTATPMALISNQSSSGVDQPWGALSSSAGYFGFAEYQPALLRSGSGSVLSSAAEQSLLFQAIVSSDHAIDIGIADALTRLNALAPQADAWTNALAQQALLADFDPARVRALDGHRQGSLIEALVPDQAVLDVSIGSQKAATADLNAGNDVGFADFDNGNGNVRVTRPVFLAVAPLGGDNIRVTVQLRQNGVDSQSLFLYQVDNLTGLVDGIMPGDQGYEDAVKSRRYSFEDGYTDLQGPGYGQYREAQVLGVNSGDLIAMGLVNQTRGHVFYGFSQANERVAGEPVHHLWSYGNGAPTYGFEDSYALGDGDFNDSVFTFNFSNPPA